MKSNTYKSLHRVMYIFLLMAILCGILIYLDMLNYFSLQNIVAMILGFLIMIFVQLRFISYYFQDKMKSLDLDEVGVIKDFIRNKIFGEINIKYINKKQKLKYYHHTQDINDKLFSQESSQIFNCAINILRAKNSINNAERIKNVKQKWQIFLYKLGLFEIFLNNLNKLFKDRALCYKKFFQKTSMINDQEYTNWGALFNKNVQYAFIQHKNEYTKLLDDIDAFDWLQLRKKIYDKYHITESKSKQILSYLLSQFNAFANQMRAELRKVSSDLQNSENQVTSSKRTCRQIEQKIKQIKQKIQSLNKKLSQKTKESDNMQSLFNIECDLRFSLVQLDNLQVRKTYNIDLHRRSLQNQYNMCVAKQNSFQSSGIRKFNNKISNYMMSYFQKLKIPFPKPKDKKQHIIQLIDIRYISGPDVNIKQAYNNMYELNRMQSHFKTFINDFIILLEEESRLIKKINGVIKEYDRQWKNNLQSKAAHDITTIQTTLDNVFLRMIESFNNQQQSMFSRIIQFLRLMQATIEKKQQKRQQIIRQHNNSHTHAGSVVKQKNGSKIQKDKNYDIQHELRIRQLYIFELENKLPSCLKDIFAVLIQGYSVVTNQIDQEKQLVDQKIRQTNNFDPRINRMNQYKDQIFKLQRQQFIRQQEEQNRGSDEQKADQSSLALVNRLLDVFANQWRNSQFFHDILKQEIQVSLNAKRPPILNYMFIKYIKIHEKQPNSLESLTILSDNVFICAFEAKINFKGKIAIDIETEIKGKKIPVSIKLLVTQFICPLKICFTPFALGKSYMSMMKTPKLKVQYSVTISGYQLTRIPFLSVFLEIFIVIKLRKKFLHPKKATIKVPMAVKNALSQAIKQTLLYQKLFSKKRKQD